MKQAYSALAVTLLCMALMGCSAPATSGTGSTNTANANSAANSTETRSQAPSNPLVGQSAPDFALQKLDGSGTVQLKDLLGKQPILLNAWASWCGPCQRETPALVKAAKDYAGKVQIVGINMTSQDSAADAKAFVDQYHVTYSTLMDADQSFLTNYRIFAFPTTFLISPSGKILDAYVGGMTEPALQKFLQEATSSHT